VAISAIIELIQPIIGRSFDVDDIVMNSLGIICGRIIFAVIERKKKK
jgi:glycopeptide antibiotics resistance protein